jgi:hypothetical protein
MHFKNTSGWFWTSVLLLIVLLVVIIYPHQVEESESTTPKDEINSSPDSLQLTYLPYIRFVEAINLTATGKISASHHILKELLGSDETALRKAAEFELRRSRNTHDEPQEKPDKATTEDGNYILQPLKTREAKIELREMEFTQSNLDYLRNTQTFLHLISSKGKKFEYFGETANLKANGYGIGVYESGSVYKGYWKDNLRQGKGIFTWVDGERYEGDYIQDLREGQGIYFWKNGERYEGNWKNDRRQGEGIVYRKNGKIKNRGIWEDDKLIKVTKD